MILTNDVDEDKLAKNFSSDRILFHRLYSDRVLDAEDQRKITEFKALEDKKYGRPELPKNKTLKEIFADPSFQDVIKEFGMFTFFNHAFAMYDMRER